MLDQFSGINTFIFDVDGVFTDGSLLVTEEGNLLRTMHSRDGYAVKHALDRGYQVVIITGGTSLGVKKRLEGLGVQQIYIAVKDKLSLLHELVAEQKIDTSKSLYMGDDLPDYEIMQEVFLPTCPKDAAPEIIAISKYVSPYKGGAGCVRDVIESVLKLQNHWM